MTSYIQEWIGSASGNGTQRYMFQTFGIGAFIAAAVILAVLAVMKKRKDSNRE